MAVDGRPRVVVLRPLGLGDLLAAVPALRGLRLGFPGHRILLACSPTLAPLALHTGAVDEVVPAEPHVPLPPAAARAPVAVDLHGRGPRSHHVLLATEPTRLIAWEHPDVPESYGMPRWDQDEHEVERWCRLLAESGIAADPSDLDLEPLPGLAPSGARGATLIHPGAGYRARRWPAERFAAVARDEASRGNTVVITGTAHEVGLARWIADAAGLPRSSVHAGATGLLELVGLVSAARRVICGDTGVGHIATAVGTPSVLLFGPTAPGRWGPPVDRPKHRVLWSGRTGDPHGDQVDPGLAEIGVADVLAELDALDEHEGEPRPIEPAAA